MRRIDGRRGVGRAGCLTYDLIMASERVASKGWKQDAVVLTLLAAGLGLLVLGAREVTAPRRDAVVIELSLAALPGYTALSLLRGFAAYGLSLAFTLVYGTYAARHPRAERFMLPTLDVLQAVPVLGFLPGLVLALLALFPGRTLGLELACILMIFTGQAWNMTFSFHASLKSVPLALRESAAVLGWSSWRTFRWLEVPSAMIGLVWNSMMSMAGGWFFLTVNEAFTLGNHDFRLPGIGSYMNEAVRQGDHWAMVAGVVAMTLMIVVVDQIVWRPIVAWSERFKVEETAAAEAPRSWLLDVFRHSRLFAAWREWRAERRAVTNLGDASSHVTPVVSATVARGAKRRSAWWRVLRGATRVVIVAGLIVFAALGLVALGNLLRDVPLYDPRHGHDWLTVLLALGASFLRTSAAVALGALWAVPAGVLIGLSRTWSRRLQPVIQVVASFPAPMLFPLVTLALQALRLPFTVGCVGLLLLGSQWYILFNVLAGAMAIPSDLKEAATACRWGWWKRWRSLYLPAVFPHAVTGLVTAAGGAWNATIVSEYVQVRGETLVAFGLGSLISEATAAGQFGLLCASVLSMALFVVGFNRIVWKRLDRLAETRYSLNM